ncbi:chemotaxis protein CheB [Methylobacterium terricola]|uniref:protein-glutamate methylesterase n=1 Tax=Methylobacterium terricola TaxID=2583531 RepID=A0A5C4L673_9HYPH|nr:chemotaxis protein CheB [Methylobacterium terricola]TNC05708.1 chemotaxis protein CheB [Methylobacterium terricola]
MPPAHRPDDPVPADAAPVTIAPLHDIVVIGGSAGAVAPLRAILASLPPGSRASVLVVLHMASGGSLAARLGPNPGPLPLVPAEDGTAIQPGRVYLAAADRHLLVEPGLIRLGHGPRENTSRPAIDALFRSAALAYGPRVVGVLLSGFLHDGAAGLDAIKARGGLALVQDPDEAEAPDMPRSALVAVPADACAPTGGLGAALARLVARPPGAPGAVPEDLALEVAIAAGRPSESLAETMGRSADPAPITCPDCGGVLSQLRQGRVLRFRCQIGHAYTAEALAGTHGDAIEDALRIALRIVKERADLVGRMAADAGRRGNAQMAGIYAERAREYDGHVRTIRRALRRGSEG